MATYADVREALGEACRTLSEDLSVYFIVPRSISVPGAVIQAQFPAVEYVNAMSSDSATWYCTVMIFVGGVNEESAQDRLGELISPGSRILEALEDVEVDDGYTKVTDGSISEMGIGTAILPYARFSVTVRT